MSILDTQDPHEYRIDSLQQAYTASILTFLFANSGKPIVVTGAQVGLFHPLQERRS